MKITRMENNSSNEDLKSMKILSVLERLGYPMDQMGTYLYEEVISSACESLASVTGARRDMELCKDILSQLKNCFSSFYRQIAREYLEMGIQSFHFMIEQSIKDIQVQSMDLDLSYQIFGASPVEPDYGSQAFQIALYTMGFAIEKEVKPPVVRRLSNTPVFVIHDV